MAAEWPQPAAETWSPTWPKTRASSVSRDAVSFKTWVLGFSPEEGFEAPRTERKLNWALPDNCSHADMRITLCSGRYRLWNR